jgi:Spy/CpxP family protein refolding chaperone
MSIKSTLGLLLGALLITATFTPSVLSANAPKKAQAKPFLIQGKLPHLTMMVKMMWDDKDLALTKVQKQKLLKIRKETIGGIKKLKPKIMALENKIVQASNSGANPASLKKDLYKLANLRAKASMIHLRCIYNTRKVLTQDQRDILE